MFGWDSGIRPFEKRTERLQIVTAKGCDSDWRPCSYLSLWLSNSILSQVVELEEQFSTLFVLIPWIHMKMSPDHMKLFPVFAMDVDQTAIVRTTGAPHPDMLHNEHIREFVGVIDNRSLWHAT